MPVTDEVAAAPDVGVTGPGAPMAGGVGLWRPGAMTVDSAPMSGAVARTTGAPIVDSVWVTGAVIVDSAPVTGAVALTTGAVIVESVCVTGAVTVDSVWVTGAVIVESVCV